MHITAQGPRLRNDLYCVEWDVKLYYTIPYHTVEQWPLKRRERERERGRVFNYPTTFCDLGAGALSRSTDSVQYQLCSDYFSVLKMTYYVSSVASDQPYTHSLTLSLTTRASRC